MEPSTHNVAALSERNTTDYKAFDEEAEAEADVNCEVQGRNSPDEQRAKSSLPRPVDDSKHPHILAKYLSTATDAVHDTLARQIQRMEKSRSFKRLQAKARPVYTDHVKPHLDIAHTNVTLTSENLKLPLESSRSSITAAASRLSALTQRAHVGLSAGWQSLFVEGGALRPLQERYSTSGGGHSSGSGGSSGVGGNSVGEDGYEGVDYDRLETRHGFATGGDSSSEVSGSSSQASGNGGSSSSSIIREEGGKLEGEALDARAAGGGFITTAAAPPPPYSGSGAAANSAAAAAASAAGANANSADAGGGNGGWKVVQPSGTGTL